MRFGETLCFNLTEIINFIVREVFCDGKHGDGKHGDGKHGDRKHCDGKHAD
jgi:hypothetical protein